jgi:hypothetical protein
MYRTFPLPEDSRYVAAVRRYAELSSGNALSG